MKFDRQSIVSFIKQCQRVLQVAKRPDRDEYYNVARITGLGIVIIGAVGFIITIIAQILTSV